MVCLIGALLCSDSDGAAVAVASGKFPLARALEAATGIGDIIPAQLVITGVAKL